MEQKVVDDILQGLSYNSKTEGYYLVCEGQKSTIVGKYTPLPKTETHFETEEELESKFIKQLQANGYEYLKIHKEDELIKNLRLQIEKLNNYKFNDADWEHFFKSEIANANNGIPEKAKLLHNDDALLTFRDSNGESKNIKLLDKKNPYKNILQIINQYEAPNGTRKCRYDMTILINGLPMVHVELKRRGNSIREAFNQINRYQRDSFWSDNGLYEYIQIFVISNGTDTKYYSNTAREKVIKTNEKQSSQQRQQTNGNFKFACNWADSENKTITELIDFTKTFFAKHVLLNILTKYCIFDTTNDLKVMRSYQIVATEKILNKIICSSNQNLQGKKEAGGYIWHTTGSGKTLTSFKTSILASQLNYIDKVLFVVDRKDLDYQTMKEYNKFQNGSANGTNSTRELENELNNTNPNEKIVITTIQKLDIFIKKNKQHPIYNKHIVLIFDECHRGHFGDLHYAITKAFKKYHIFGFTGTPIFEENAPQNPTTSQIIEVDKKNHNVVIMNKTTKAVFGDQLHCYNIVNAIKDGNVLQFRYTYCNTIKDIEDYNKNFLYSQPDRIAKIVEYILTEQYNRQTINRKFNAIFAVSSIDDVMLYYKEFQKQMETLQENKKLKFATIFSYAQNEADPEEENNEDTRKLDKTKRDFLEEAIKQYNNDFGTSYDTSSEKFQNYYKDISARVKGEKDGQKLPREEQIDLLLVVNMFLTGFDAPCLNTLFVDKELKHHSLLQAFSRTNRILNETKSHGNIVSFRDIEAQLNEAILMFGDKKEDTGNIVLIHSFEEYYKTGYQDKQGNRQRPYIEIVEKLKSIDMLDIKTPEQEKEFIKNFGEMLKIRNILLQFEDFDKIESQIISERERQDLQSKYLDLYDKYKEISRNEAKAKQAEYLSSIDVEFEIQLLKQIDIDLTYILNLITKYTKQNNTKEENLTKIKEILTSSIDFRDKKDLFLDFVSQIINNKDEENIVDKWNNYIKKRKIEELNKLIEEENLNKERTYKYMEDIFRRKKIKRFGMDIDRILPTNIGFSANSDPYEKKQTVYDKIERFLNRFLTITNSKFDF